MMVRIKNGAIVRCDIVKVSKDGTKHTKACKASFVSYSVPAVIREQAGNAEWQRTRVSLVKWPGNPPMAGSKKVDVCPGHKELVITTAEAKELRSKAKADRAAARAEAKAERKRQREARREIAKAVKEQKARRKRGEHVEA